MYASFGSSDFFSFSWSYFGIHHVFYLVFWEIHILEVCLLCCPINIQKMRKSLITFALSLLFLVLFSNYLPKYLEGTKLIIQNSSEIRGLCLMMK